MGDSHGSARASDTTATAPVTEAISRSGGGASTSVGPSPAAASPSPSINAFQAVVGTRATSAPAATTAARSADA